MTHRTIRIPLCLVLLTLGSMVPGAVHAQMLGQKICEINADGTGFRDLFVPDVNQCVGSPMYSPDGKMLAVEIAALRLLNGHFDQSGEQHSWMQMIPVSKLQSSNQNSKENKPIPVTLNGLPGMGGGSMPNWSPGGHRIAFSGTRLAGVYVMRADGTDVVRIHPQGWAARWSPDGRMIAFLNQRNGNSLWVYDLVEDEEFPVKMPTSFQRIYDGFAWSPDSRSLAISGQPRRGSPVIARLDVVNPKPGTYRELRSGSLARRLSWHPDGKRLLFAERRNNPSRLFTIASSGVQTAPELIGGIPQDLSVDSAAWTPDGKKIVFAATTH